MLSLVMQLEEIGLSLDVSFIITHNFDRKDQSATKPRQLIIVKYDGYYLKIAYSNMKWVGFAK